MRQRFENRTEGGRALAEKFLALEDREDVVVVALPRGGVPVAYELAKLLNAPLDVLLVRKLGVPYHEELAFGAIAAGGFSVLNKPLIETLRITDSALQSVITKEKAELERRQSTYRSGRPAIELRGKTVILVDDGLATGATMKAALAAVRDQKPRQIIVAAPVASREVCDGIKGSDELCICAVTPETFYGVGMWYRDFGQTSDEEVCRLLEKARAAQSESAGLR